MTLLEFSDIAARWSGGKPIRMYMTGSAMTMMSGDKTVGTTHGGFDAVVRLMLTDIGEQGDYGPALESSLRLVK